MRNIFWLMIIFIIITSCGESTTSPEPTIPAPTDLSAVLISGSALQLSWLDNSDDEEGFVIERKIAGEVYESICTTVSDQTVFIDSLISPNTQYYYRIAAFKGADRSNWCYSDLVETPVDILAPSNLTIVYLTTNRIDLEWTDNTENETGFLLQRRIAAGEFQDLILLSVDETEYSDTELDPVIEYIYRVSAQYDGGQTDWSNEAEAITPPELEEIQFGTDETLEIMTWNIENFPKNDLVTVAYVAEIVLSLDVDIVALQEIESNSYFNTMLDFLPGWEGYKANSASYNIDLAYLYKPDVIEVENIYEIYESDWYAFPRSPLVMEFTSFGEEHNSYKQSLKSRW